MNRKSFLAVLIGLPAALMAAAKPKSDWIPFEEFLEKCKHRPDTDVIQLRMRDPSVVRQGFISESFEGSVLDHGNVSQPADANYIEFRVPRTKEVERMLHGNQTFLV